MQKEAIFKRELTQILTKKHAYTVISSYSNVRGVADILTMYSGSFYALELKIEDGPVTVLQRDALEVVARNGGHSFIVRLYGDVVRIEKVTAHGDINAEVSGGKKQFKEEFPEILLKI